MGGYLEKNGVGISETHPTLTGTHKWGKMTPLLGVVNIGGGISFSRGYGSNTPPTALFSRKDIFFFFGGIG